MPILGKVIKVQNDSMGLHLVATPLAIYETFRDEGLDLDAYLDDPESITQKAEVSQDFPGFSMQGGEAAVVVLALAECIENDDFQRAEALFASGEADVLRNQESEIYPMLRAVGVGNVEWVTFLARKGLGTGIAIGLNMTALHWAAATGRAAVVQTLLEAGVDSSRLNSCLLTAGELAVLNNQSETVEVFRKHLGSSPLRVDDSEMFRRFHLLPNLNVGAGRSLEGT